MKVKFLSIFCLFLILNINKSLAQTVLSAGDIAIVAINGDNDASNSFGRGFSFVALVSLEAGTEIFFTDYGWSDVNGYFITSASVADQFAKYITPVGGLAAGTVVRFDSYHTTDFTVFYSYATVQLTTYLNVAGLTNGDEVLAFQASYNATTHEFSSIKFIYAASIVSTDFVTSGWATNVGSNGTDNFSGVGSALPGTGSLTITDLTDDATALSFNRAANANDNCAYSGPTSTATKTQWQERIKDYSNWTFNDAAPIPTPPTGPFLVSGSVISPTVTTQAASSINTTTATGNGSITATGGANATNRGVIWYAYSNTDKIIGDAGVTNVSETGTYGVATFTASLTGLAVNTRYNARAHATNSAGTSYGSRVDFWTLANVPAAPTVNNATSTSLDVAINVNSNPTGTEFAIQETSGNMYVQANGTLGASAVWQTNSNWGTKTVTGLTSGTGYTFKVKARNGANTETAFSTTTSLSTKTPGLWTGATSTDWHTTTNWDDGVVPTATVDVTIPNVTNKPVIGSAAVCRALTVQSSSSLTIQSGQTLNVKGNVTLQNSSSFSNSGTLQFSGADCHLSDNRSIKTNLGNITVTD